MLDRGTPRNRAHGRTARFARCAALPALVLTLATAAPAEAQTDLCAAADRHLTGPAGMFTIVEPDTIDDWRTDRLVPGCRITAAGLTRRSLRGEASRFYDVLRDAGWTRTPDPQDAPNEASLRFRMEGSDCLFNVYGGGLLNTDAELRVDDERVPGVGELRYNVLVLCTPAAEAAPS